MTLRFIILQVFFLGLAGSLLWAEQPLTGAGDAGVPTQDGKKADAPGKIEKITLTLNAMGHIAPISRVLFTPDGKQVITVSEDKTIRFWDAETGEHLRMLIPPHGAGREGALHAAALSPDGKLLAVGGAGRIHVLALPEWKIQKTLPFTDVTFLAFSPDGTQLAWASEDRKVQVWGVDDTKTIQVLVSPKKKDVEKKSKGMIAFAPDGQKLLAWTSNAGAAKGFWDLKSGEKSGSLATTGLSLAGIRWLGWHPKGNLIATVSGGGEGGTLAFWKTDGALAAFIDGIWSGGFLPDGQLLALTTGKQRELRIIDPHSPKVLRTLKSPVNEVGKFQRLEVSADGKLAALYALSPFGVTHDVLLVQLPSGKLGPHLGKTYADRGSKGIVGFHPNGTAVARPWHSGSGRFFDFATLRPGSILKDSDEVQGPKYEDAARTLEADKSAGLNVLKIIKGGTTKVIKTPVNMTAKGARAAYTFAGQEHVAVGAVNGEVMLFRSDTGKLERRIQAHNGVVFQVAPSKDGRFVVSHGDDHLLCIWNIADDRPLLYLFGPSKMLGPKMENEWVAWTPEGYYAASPGGEKLIGWTIDRGPEQMAEFVPADRFRKQFHRPDVIQRLLEFGSVEKALEAADKERGIKSARVDIEDALPPQVTLTMPAAVKEAKVTINVKATPQGKFPISELQLLVNGRPHAQGLHSVKTPKFGPVEASWPIELTPGSHVVSVVARTQVSSGVSSDVEVVYAPSVAPDPKSLLPALHVLSIGINNYAGDWKLHCAVNDAMGIRKVFEERSATTYRGVSSKLLTDAEATKENILAELAALRKNVKPQDVAVIFFAGHGVKGKKGAFYLCPHGTDFADVEKTALSNHEIKRTLAQMQGRILVMLDACHSGASRLDEFARELTDDDCGVIVMCAAMGRETAGEAKKLGHGYFAKAVIDGLNGKADVSRKDGQVYLHHLYKHVVDAVEEWTQDEQHPVMSIPMSVRSFALAKPR